MSERCAKVTRPIGRGIRSRPLRNSLLLLGVVVAALGSYSMNRTTTVLAQEIDQPNEDEQSKQDVDVTTRRWVEATRMQQVRDPETGAVTEVPVRVFVPVTETVRRGAGGGVPLQSPTREEVYQIRDPATGKMLTQRRRVPYDAPVTGPLLPPVTAVSEAESRALRMAMQLRQAEDEPEREKLRQQLKDALGEAFDQRRQQQLQAIDRLEQQLDSLRELDMQREKRKEEIVQRRLEELVGQPDVLAWDLPAAAPATRFDPSGPNQYSSASSQRPSMPPRPLPLPAPQADDQPEQKYKDYAKRIIQRNDRNGDGDLTVDEWKSMPLDPSVADSDGDRRVTEREYAQWMQRRSSLPLPMAEVGSLQPSKVTPQASVAPQTSVAAPPSTALPANVAVRMEAAQRIVDLLAEVQQLRAEIESLRSRRPPRFIEQVDVLASKEQIAQAKLQIAELGWKSLQQQLTNEVQLAKRQSEAAHERLQTMQREHKSSPFARRVDSGDAHKADAELQIAEARLDGWRQTEAILQKQRAMLSGSESSFPSTATEIFKAPAGPDPAATFDPAATK